MKKILLLSFMLPLLWQETSAQNYNPLKTDVPNRKLLHDPLHDPITYVRPQDNIDANLSSRKQATIHRTITDLGEIAEGQLYGFRVNVGNAKSYPSDHQFLKICKVSSILIPENSGIRTFDLTTDKIIATLDTKDRYGDYRQEIDMVTYDGVITFVIKAHIVDAGVLKAALDQKKADVQ